MGVDIVVDKTSSQQNLKSLRALACHRQEFPCRKSLFINLGLRRKSLFACLPVGLPAFGVAGRFIVVLRRTKIILIGLISQRNNPSDLSTTKSLTRPLYAIRTL